MKKTLIALMALTGVAAAAEATPLLDVDFAAGSTIPSGWTTSGWKNASYTFSSADGAKVNGWQQGRIETSVALNSSKSYEITFTLKNIGTTDNPENEDTGNMFYLSSENYSIVIGNSYSGTYSEIHVGTLDEAVGASGQKYVCFQPSINTETDINNHCNPTVLDKSSGVNVSGELAYTLTMVDGTLSVSVKKGNTDLWSTATPIVLESNVTFTKLGFIQDGEASVKSVKVVPEPTTATLSLLALAGLAARRRRK